MVQLLISFVLDLLEVSLHYFTSQFFIEDCSKEGEAGIYLSHGE